ncbi:hypothetical protein SCG7109_AE_00200 [Chlamydiales bacterium SCGC AG-110-M15]|nr:hypothetical protein SCG7109_AE_00200 [Chlamydiales bacterium SCGC AG-110-M15]
MFFGRRYYEPLTGRWTTQDPLGFADGPNLYAYVHNDPLRFIDYEGLYHRAIHSGSSFRTKQEEATFYFKPPIPLDSPKLNSGLKQCLSQKTVSRAQ